MLSNFLNFKYIYTNYNSEHIDIISQLLTEICIGFKSEGLLDYNVNFDKLDKNLYFNEQVKEFIIYCVMLLRDARSNYYLDFELDNQFSIILNSSDICSQELFELNFTKKLLFYIKDIIYIAGEKECSITWFFDLINIYCSNEMRSNIQDNLSQYFDVHIAFKKGM